METVDQEKHCINHPASKGLAFCKRCNGHICRDCIIIVEGKGYCKECYLEAQKNKATPKRCINHPDKLGIAYCKKCGGYLCQECMIFQDGKKYCRKCYNEYQKKTYPQSKPLLSQRCFYHSNVKSISRCETCGIMICGDCIVQNFEKTFCKPCFYNYKKQVVKEISNDKSETTSTLESPLSHVNPSEEIIKLRKSVKSKQIIILLMLSLFSIGVVAAIFMIHYYFNKKTTINYSQTSSKPISTKIVKSVKIGDQIWMAENLDVETYRNGDEILEITSKADWRKAGFRHIPASCYYNCDSKQPDLYNETYNWYSIENRYYDLEPKSNYRYGRLYNWFAIDDIRNIAPEGWHVPSTAEWMKLVNYLGGYINAANKLKETGTAHWVCPNPDVTNETGFSALPAGIRDSDHNFTGLGNETIFWTSDGYRLPIGNFAGRFSLRCDNNQEASFGIMYRSMGCSVRCIKD